MRYRGHGWGADSLVARYGYDVLGRRIARRVYWSPLPGAEARETRYLYQGGQVVAETDAAGAFKWKYTWGPGTDNLVGLQDSTGTQFYVVQDQLGSVRGLVKRDGTWVMSQRFTPAGQLLARDSVGGHQWPKGLHVGWTGRETDPETGLSFHRARYYSPELRRWTQEDPIGYGGGGNLYAYVGGAVLEGRDPSGLFAEVGDLGLGFAEQETFSGGGELSMCLVFCTDARDREDQRWEEWWEERSQGTKRGVDPGLLGCKLNTVCKQEYDAFYEEGGRLRTERVVGWKAMNGHCPIDHRPCSTFSGDGSGRNTLELRMWDDPIAWDAVASLYRRGRVDWGILVAHEIAEARGSFAGWSAADSHRYAVLIESQARNANPFYAGTGRRK
ncbi:MAG: RHS repeat-associated core domain-containing protein [Gemmatimonadetes bacterium]|nr:RHS repeat-associated core domain-containing protein [Gemmatimonadota bacterium]MBK7350458.1 RHS repeat-associated core domain-containing protein [Gemmatimonadota bacterium]MBK7716289.1 RHS repeat-associated core domain-containing protein [Gemmatimonadota bacterium]MBK7785603.1 RHS repeat-associated core domain-containing protein [Gemmatimonadota bacterium]MBK7923523.1 RHS repeat-associated core domain-containing protein [Gemmatimonadota bacterium]